MPRYLARLSCLAALAVLVGAVGASARDAKPSAASPAAARFAEAWAEVPASAAARKARNIVVFGLSLLVDGFGPNAQGEGFSTVGGFESTRGAFRPTSRGTWVKDLVTEARATKTSLSYTISPKAFWYWGGRKVPVTYRDFVYTLQMIANDPSNRFFGVWSLDPTRFTHQGAKRVTFFWRTSGCSTNTPCGPTASWQGLFDSIFPSFALKGLDFSSIWSNCICGSDGRPVSDGPFYLASYVPGQEVVLRANPYWGGAKPGLGEIDFRLFGSSDILSQALLLGDVDAAPLPPANSPFRAQLERTPRFRIEHFVRTNLEQLQLREGAAPAGPGVTRGSSNVLLRAPWMRQAIMLGLDRQAIIDTALGPDSGAKPADNLLYYPSHAGYTPDLARWDYNPREALAILKAHCSGGTGPSLPDPANTRIWQCAGLPATFRWTWAAERTDRTMLEQLAKRQLLSIGIALTERPLPANIIYTPSGILSGDFDIANFAENTTGDPGDWITQYSCGGDNNDTGFCSAKVDALLKAAGAELDPAKRATDFQAAERLLADTVPVIPLYAPTAGLVHKSDLLGIQTGPSAYNAPETWHWRN